MLRSNFSLLPCGWLIHKFLELTFKTLSLTP